ncbi:hypothetical protein Hanom_Chr12g01176051 [Helianthus anomalus]
MHQSIFVPIAKCYVPFVQCLCKTTTEPGVSLEAASLFQQGRGKTLYILPPSDPTLALLLVGFTEYDDDESNILLERIMITRLWSMRDRCLQSGSEGTFSNITR